MPIDDRPGDGGNHEVPDTADVATAGSFAMLLGEADLVGHGWEVTEERSWPTGGLDPESEKSKRAVEAGGITAWRSLADAGSPRTAWFEVVPYASPVDAELSLRQVPRFFVGTDRPDETVVAERLVDDQVLPGSTDTWIYEKSTTGPQGDRLARYVGGTVDHILVLTCFTGPEETWSWADVLTLTALQVERIRLALAAG